MLEVQLAERPVCEEHLLAQLSQLNPSDEDRLNSLMTPVLKQGREQFAP